MFIENVTYNYLLALDTNVPESYGLIRPFREDISIISPLLQKC